ncbi:MAG: hypothetical protein L6406_15965 [Desulfobacterales bacterium]|nr:hypothetical protein [Pseudomonadota bacterium]MCG2777166.1 hypothetical protein [Desulfobacterales bacterium]
MSEYDRRTGVKHLKVRGLKAVRFCATLKAIGVNIFRATAVRKTVSCDQTAHGSSLCGQMCVIHFIKEHLLMALSQLRKFFVLFIRNYGLLTFYMDLGISNHYK